MPPIQPYHKTICPSCKEDPPDLAYPEPHSTVCASCGLVLDDRAIDSGPEWRTFTSSSSDTPGQDPSRVGNTHVFDTTAGHLETRISDGGTNRASGIRRAQERQSARSNQQKVLDAYGAIEAFCENALVSSSRVKDAAKDIYTRVHDADGLKERRDVLLVGCVFVACRRLNVSRTFAEMGSLTGVSKSELGRVVRVLDDFLKQHPHSDPRVPPVPDSDVMSATGTEPGTRIVQLVPRFTSHLDLPYVVTSRAMSLAERVAERGILDGRSPLTVSAACIYFCVRLLAEGSVSVSMGDVAQVAGVSAPTVGSAVRVLDAEGNLAEE